MDIVVCVKRVADVTGADIRIAPDRHSISPEGLVFDTNEGDKYAIEEAVRLKEKHGGRVTAITVGEDSDETLRRCFVMGCDDAVCIPGSSSRDALTTATALHSVIKGMKFDLVLTGVLASDDGFAQVGPCLAALLDIPCVTAVNLIEIQEGSARLHRELEGGLTEAVEVKLPALLAIQTGINEPRYVSIRALMKVADREIKTVTVAPVAATGATYELSLPPPPEDTAMLPSEPGAAAEALLGVLKEQGVLK